MSQRIEQIDFLRGFALLGLPLMNIVAFALPIAAYINPQVYADADFMNHALFSFLHIFADQKFMGLFSILFGASVLLLVENLKQKDLGAARAHYFRMFWLLLIGAVHGAFIWKGDILTIYAFFGFFIYWFKGLGVRWLIILSVFLLALSALLVSQLDASEANIGKESKQMVNAYLSPSDEQIANEKTLYTSDYASLLAHRLAPEEPTFNESAAVLILLTVSASSLANVFSLMLLGMAFYKIGVFTGGVPPAYYKNMLLWGSLLGLPMIIVGLAYNYSMNWETSTQIKYGLTPNLIGGYMLTIGYIGGLVLLFKSQRLNWIKAKIAHVGRMALTNYLSQSVIFGFIFYGYGLSLWGELSRLQLLPIVAAIWIVQIAFSNIWLKYFLQGPVEWVWRLLSYFSVPAFVRKRAE